MRVILMGVLAAAALCAVVVHPVDGAQQAGATKPTEVLHLMIHEMLAQPDRPQAQNTEKFIGLAARVGLDRVERMALAEAYFLAFMPDAAKAIYQTFMNDGDELGRLAWQRMMRITFAAEDRPDEAARMLTEFYQHFKPTPSDQSYGSQQARDLALHWEKKGDLEKAIGFIVAEFKALPLDGPYVGLTLPGRSYELFVKGGRGAEAVELTRRALEGVRSHAAAENITGNRYAQLNRGLGAPHRAGALHNVAAGLINDVPDFDQTEYQRGRIFSTVQQLQGLVSSMR